MRRIIGTVVLVLLLFSVAASGSPSTILDAEEELAEMLFSLSVA